MTAGATCSSRSSRSRSSEIKRSFRIWIIQKEQIQADGSFFLVSRPDVAMADDLGPIKSSPQKSPAPRAVLNPR